ncbi:hypothetical protein [Streptomyces sp. N50]|uniref:hypothetical protein n=1 Tax=Streptomyces sp. N50 TaxID=3081765 RepID=UPI00296226DE|nr:hypothetical protein [Streptomyces sp. N50]WOX11564.1 hypothetical protein R2B38_23220 [Streptomyces sp. N50]
MSITQQYFLDVHRAQRLGEVPPPPPGTHDWRTVREVRGHRLFRAVVAGRPAHGRLRRALDRRRRPRARAAC